jgi:thymidine kinase
MAYFKIITGPMFSGKTEELIRLLHRSQIAGKKLLVVKPRIDSRTQNEIASRKKTNLEDGGFKKFMEFPAIPVSSADEIAALIDAHRPDVLGLDEAQFFEPWILNFVHTLLHKQADSDILILAAGLDMDAWGKPFGSIPELMAIANEVQKETAICFSCKQPATITQKLVNTGKTVEVGDAEIYEARCRKCHTMPEEAVQAQAFDFAAVHTEQTSTAVI